MPTPAPLLQVIAAAAVAAPPALDWEKVAADLDLKSPLEIMDHVRHASSSLRPPRLPHRPNGVAPDLGSV